MVTSLTLIKKQDDLEEKVLVPGDPQCSEGSCKLGDLLDDLAHLVPEDIHIKPQVERFVHALLQEEQVLVCALLEAQTNVHPTTGLPVHATGHAAVDQWLLKVHGPADGAEEHEVKPLGLEEVGVLHGRELGEEWQMLDPLDKVEHQLFTKATLETTEVIQLHGSRQVRVSVLFQVHAFLFCHLLVDELEK